MTRMQLIARLVVTYLLMYVLSGLLSGFHTQICFAKHSSAAFSTLQTVLLLASILAIPPLLFYVLLVIVLPRIDGIFGPNGHADKVHDKWIIGGHRLVLMYFGLVFITSKTDFLIAAPRHVIRRTPYDPIAPPAGIAAATHVGPCQSPVWPASAGSLWIGAVQR